MKMTVSTKKLQELMNKALKCAICKPKIIISGMMAISLKDGVLTLIASDGNNYLYVSDDCEGDDFYVVVDVPLFSKLISKLTCDNITMKVVNDSLEIDGNGHYVIGLPYDGEGELVKFPDPRQKLTNEANNTMLKLSTLKMIVATAKASVDFTADYEGCYSGYYMGPECVVTTDSFKVCWIDVGLFKTPIIVRRDTMDLIQFLSDEEVSVVNDGKYIIFNTSKCTIFAQLIDSVSDFRVDAVKQYITSEFAQTCTVFKADLMQVLDRLSLFVAPVDENGIFLTFGQDELKINSRQSDGEEVIEYAERVDGEQYACCLDIVKFGEQVKSVLSDSVTICYNNPNAVKIEDGNVTKIVSLFAED